MKNAVFYRDNWLMPNSKARELYDIYLKTKDSKDRKKLDDHCKEVDKVYKQLSGVSV